MKKLLIITLGIFIFGFVSFKVFSAKIVKDASALENTFIEVKNIPDGSYKGHSELGPVIVDVNVIIKDGKYGVMDKEGNSIIDPKYENIKVATSGVKSVNKKVRV